MKKKFDAKTKNKISKILAMYGDLMKDNQDILKDDGNLDIGKVAQHPNTISVIAELKRLGVEHNRDLMDAGFVAGAMLLRF